MPVERIIRNEIEVPIEIPVYKEVEYIVEKPIMIENIIEKPVP